MRRWLPSILLLTLCGCEGPDTARSTSGGAGGRAEACSDGLVGGAANACGGSCELPYQPGAPCGSRELCDAGVFVCDGPNRVTCTSALPEGRVESVHAIGGDGLDVEIDSALLPGADVVLLGKTSRPFARGIVAQPGGNVTFLARVDVEGDLLWARSLHNLEPIGPLAVDVDGHVHLPVTGGPSFLGPSTLSPGEPDAITVASRETVLAHWDGSGHVRASSLFAPSPELADSAAVRAWIAPRSGGGMILALAIVGRGVLFPGQPLEGEVSVDGRSQDLIATTRLDPSGTALDLHWHDLGFAGRLSALAAGSNRSFLLVRTWDEQSFSRTLRLSRGADELELQIDSGSGYVLATLGDDASVSDAVVGAGAFPGFEGILAAAQDAAFLATTSAATGDRLEPGFGLASNDWLGLLVARFDSDLAPGTGFDVRGQTTALGLALDGDGTLLGFSGTGDVVFERGRPTERVVTLPAVGGIALGEATGDGRLRWLVRGDSSFQAAYPRRVHRAGPGRLVYVGGASRKPPGPSADVGVVSSCSNEVTVPLGPDGTIVIVRAGR